nr:hypothetical protein HK105_001876 [Polyrhizophydium stewartii]
MPAEIQNEILDAAGPFTKFVNGLLLAAELRGLPKRLREQVWQDASDTDWQGDVGVLPRFDISSKSLNLRSRSLLRRCKHMNLDKEIVHVAVRNGWDDPLDFGKPDELARIAAIEGNTRLMRDLIEERQSAKPDFSVTDLRECDLDEAHRQCDSDLLKHFYGRGMPLIRESVESAVRCCNVALLDWAVKRDRDVIPKLILQTACYGDPALIEWWRVKHGITFSQRELEFAISSRNIRFAVVLLATDDNKWDLEAADKAMFGVRENWCGLDSDSEDERQDEEFRKQILQAIGLVAARRDAQAV